MLICKHTVVPRLLQCAVVCLFVLCLPSADVNAQGQPDIVRAVVDGLRSTEHAQLADGRLRHIPGVVMSRTDHNTSNLMMHVATDVDIDAALLNSALLRIGLHVRCLRRAAWSDGPFRQFDPDNCEEAQQVR